MIYYMKRVELEILITIKVLKNVDDMSDREMFHEYDKMRKQSYLVKKLYSSWFRQRDKNGFTINMSHENSKASALSQTSSEDL